MVLEDHRTPTFSVSLVMRTSYLGESPDLPGLADATATVIRLGTQTRNARQIAEELAELGGSIGFGGSTGSRTTSASVSGLTENMDDLLALFADVLFRPSFPQAELDNLKQRMLSSLQASRAQPSFLAGERLYAMLYPGDARKMTAPSEESIKKLTRQQLIDHYNANYRPAGGLIGVAGDVSAKEMAAKLDKLLGDWKGAPPEPPKLPLERAIPEKKVVLIHRPNSVQTYLMVANRAIGRMDPDYIACMLMNQVLGSGPASRLFRNIREEKGYTYGISSGFSAGWYFNHFTSSTQVRSEVTGAALEEILKEFRDVRDRLVPADELDGARRAVVGSFARSLESTSGMLGRAMELKEYGFPADYWDKYPELIMKLTPEQVREAARKYVPVDNIQIVAVGDADKIRDQLKKFGPVEEYTSEGKPVAGAGR
jgi:predicted Zn-dependent peptidase